jgi:fluoride ion exporter CrcB/FEX
MPNFSGACLRVHVLEFLKKDFMTTIGKSTFVIQVGGCLFLSCCPLMNL